MTFYQHRRSLLQSSQNILIVNLNLISLQPGWQATIYRVMDYKTLLWREWSLRSPDINSLKALKSIKKIVKSVCSWVYLHNLSIREEEEFVTSSPRTWLLLRRSSRRRLLKLLRMRKRGCQQSSWIWHGRRALSWFSTRWDPQSASLLPKVPSNKEDWFGQLLKAPVSASCFRT